MDNIRIDEHDGPKKKSKKGLNMNQELIAGIIASNQHKMKAGTYELMSMMDQIRNLKMTKYELRSNYRHIITPKST